MKSDAPPRPRQLLTLAFLTRPGEILLGWKKRGFGKHRWNGFGGKVDPGEHITHAAVREIKEECGLVVPPSSLEKFAIFEWEFANDPVIYEAHAYRTSTFTGTLTESEEMKPQWFSTSKLPFDDMWTDNRLWFPWLLDGTNFRGHTLFDTHKNEFLSYKFTEFEDTDKVILEKVMSIV